LKGIDLDIADTHEVGKDVDVAVALGLRQD